MIKEQWVSYHDVAADADTLDRLLRAIFEGNWAHVAFGSNFVGGSMELSLEQAPTLSHQNGMMNVVLPNGRGAIHIGTAGPARDRCHRVAFIESNESGSPDPEAFGVRFWNSQGQQTMTVYFAGTGLSTSYAKTGSYEDGKQAWLRLKEEFVIPRKSAKGTSPKAKAKAAPTDKGKAKPLKPRQACIVIDNFYPEPDRIRELALSLPYDRLPNARYPGVEAIAPGIDWSDVKQRMREHIHEPVDGVGPKDPPFPQGKFRLALAKDQKKRLDRCHVDVQPWSGIVYLTPDEYCESGVVLYRHIPTKSRFLPEKYFYERYPDFNKVTTPKRRAMFDEFFTDKKQFEPIGTIPMQYNRCILLMAHALHGTGTAFGTKPENGRLTQHFEFYAGKPADKDE
jgi:hypothetical protein